WPRGLFLVLAQAGEDRVVLERGGVADRLLAGSDVAQQTAHDLAAAGLRERVGEANVVRTREGADLLRDVLAERLPEFLRRRPPGFEGHEGRDRLALQVVGSPDHRGLGDGGMAHQRALDLHRSQAVARDVHHVVDPTHDPEVAVLVATGAVAREVDARHLAPVLLAVALGIAVHAAPHPGPPAPADGVTTL